MTYSNIPNDPVMLLSFINTKLRDEYGSLQALCDDLELDAAHITEKLSSIGYTYDGAVNKFL